MKKSSRGIYNFFSKISNIIHYRLVLPVLRGSCAQCGTNVLIGKQCRIDYENLYLGNNILIGNNAEFLSTKAKIHIGNDVMFGPHVFIVTGDHRTDIIGMKMFDITNDYKRPEDDLDVIIENDVWIGMNAMILKGVKIAEGSIVAAGSIVTKSTEPFSINVGIPAKKLGMRFSEEDLLVHKKMLAEKKGV